MADKHLVDVVESLVGPLPAGGGQVEVSTSVSIIRSDNCSVLWKSHMPDNGTFLRCRPDLRFDIAGVSTTDESGKAELHMVDYMCPHPAPFYTFLRPVSFVATPLIEAAPILITATIAIMPNPLARAPWATNNLSVKVSSWDASQSPAPASSHVVFFSWRCAFVVDETWGSPL
jgi:hypothetical protein